jgi:MFS family permease
VKKNSTENIIVLIRFFSSLCEQTLIFSLPLLFYITSNNNLKTSSFAFSIIQFADLVALPIAGFIIARFFAYKVFFVSDFFRGILCILIYFLIKSEFVYVFLFLYGFLCAVTLVNIETAIPKIFKYYSLSEKQSIVQIIEQSTLILGPALASLFLYFSMFHIVLIVCSIVFMTSGICMYTENISKILMFKNENNQNNIKHDFYPSINGSQSFRDRGHDFCHGSNIAPNTFQKRANFCV